MLKCFLVALGLVAGLSGCTASDAITVRQLTIVDGAAFVQENHDRRRAMRQQYYQVVDEVVAKCKEAARAATFEGELDEALVRVDWCLAFIDEHYPDLATIELLREGTNAFNDLQMRLGANKAP